MSERKRTHKYRPLNAEFYFKRTIFHSHVRGAAIFKEFFPSKMSGHSWLTAGPKTTQKSLSERSVRNSVKVGETLKSQQSRNPRVLGERERELSTHRKLMCNWGQVVELVSAWTPKEQAGSAIYNLKRGAFSFIPKFFFVFYTAILFFFGWLLDTHVSHACSPIKEFPKLSPYILLCLSL